MKKSIIYLLLLSFSFSFSFTSCEDMLDVQSDRHSYETAQDTLYAYWGILKSLQEVGERQVLLGELRGDLVMPNLYDGEVSDSLAGIANFTSINDGDCRYLQARDYYAIINNCNAYIAAADTSRIVYGGTTTNSKYMLREYAQVEAIRAWVYLQLVQLYGEVPFYLDPLTSTDAINDFINNPNHQTANRTNLPALIEPRLLPLINNIYLDELPNPQYGEYKLMAHSSFCLFPLQLVMGDIYLNADEYEKAAQQYYWWMRKDMYTAVPNIAQNNVSVRPYTANGVNTFFYNIVDDCFNLSSSHARTNGDETITVIPGTTNKLWGTVMRGVNEAFGFISDVRVNTTGANADSAVTSSSVTLTPITYRRQFIASNEFKRITRAYPCIEVDENRTKDLPQNLGLYAYRYLPANGSDPDTARDGRYAWLRTFFAEAVGGQHTNDSLFIHKQNPGGAFSTTYPVVYRRALVWLRFAEAINRAGHPEYAFAVLRDGLFKDIIPTADQCKLVAINDVNLTCLRTQHDEVVENEDAEEDAEPEVITTYTYQLLEAGATDDGSLADNQEIVTLENVSYEMSPAEYEALMTSDAESTFTIPVGNNISIEVNITALRTYLDEFMPATINTNINSAKFVMQTAEYIPSHEILLASNMHSAASSNGVSLQTQVSEYLDFTSNNFTSTYVDRRLGIHQHGNGYSVYTSCGDSLYTFDNCVRSKWPEYRGQLNKYIVSADEYAEYQQRLIEAVEELIIDELALECCFEGNRYNDLVRFSYRSNRGTSWLTDRVNVRGLGLPTYSRVNITPDNMYLKLPLR